MNEKCNKCKDGYQSIIWGDISKRLKCKCEIPKYSNWKVGEIARYDIKLNEEREDK